MSECRVPVYQSGVLFATKAGGDHYWQLHTVEGVPIEDAPKVYPTPTSPVYVWYCTRCRIVERTNDRGEVAA